MRAALLAFILCGCSSGGSGGGGGSDGGDGSAQGRGSVEGTIHGHPMVVADAISARISLGGDSTIGTIFLSTVADACDGRTATSLRANETAVEINLVDATVQRSVAPTAPGTFIWGESEFQASGYVNVANAQCGHMMSEKSVIDRGTVHLTAVAGDVFTGDFDVMLDTGEHLTGTFNPTACPSLNSVTPMPCM